MRRRTPVLHAAQVAFWVCLYGCLLATTRCGADQDRYAGSFIPPVASREAIVHASPTVLPHFEATGAPIVATQHNAQAVRTQLCTATLIAPNYIVTAAHCTPLKARMGVWEAGEPKIAGGTERQDTPSRPTAKVRGAQRAQDTLQVWYAFCLRDSVAPGLGVGQGGDPACTVVTAFATHPNYRLPGPWDEGLVDAYDVAVARLERSNTSVAPALLAVVDDAAYVYPGQSVSIAGFGSTQDHAALGPAAHASGVKRYACSRVGQVSAIEMTVGEPPCAAHKSFGDSGGPTFVQTPGGARLTGITSRLLADTDAAMGTVDTRLDALRPWVSSIAELDDGPHNGDGDTDDDDPSGAMDT